MKSGARKVWLQKWGVKSWARKVGDSDATKVRKVGREKCGEKSGARKVGRERWGEKSGARKVGHEKWGEKSVAPKVGCEKLGEKSGRQ